ncbi:MAG TPA: VOC family protein [Chitinophagaceae bacterium]|jgi:PhnB protein|nr:VOC family protein [Chitinophagaceae bacterium]
MSTQPGSTFFAPELYIANGVTDVSFYKNAFGATENLCYRNDDGSIHVVEFSIDGVLFHVHEITSSKFVTPGKNGGCTCCIGFFVPDVDAAMNRAISAGAVEIQPAQDYDYGYRQGTIRDPFGHYWQIQKKLGNEQ